jgi:hypothetical protein
MKTVQNENRILKKLAGTLGITEQIDYFEDNDDIVPTSYLVMKNAGS